MDTTTTKDETPSLDWLDRLGTGATSDAAPPVEDSGDQTTIPIKQAEARLDLKRKTLAARRDEVEKGKASLITIREKLAGLEKDLRDSDDDQTIWEAVEKTHAELIAAERAIGPNERRAQLAAEAVSDAEKHLKKVKLDSALRRASAAEFVTQSKGDFQRIGQLVEELICILVGLDERHSEALTAWSEVRRLSPERGKFHGAGPRGPYFSECIMPRELRHLVVHYLKRHCREAGIFLPNLGPWLDPDVVADYNAKGQPHANVGNADGLHAVHKPIHNILDEVGL